MEDFQNPVFSAPIEGSLEDPAGNITNVLEENTTLDEPVKETIVSCA